MQTKEGLVHSKQLFSLVHMSKSVSVNFCLLSSPFEILIILQSSRLLITLYPFTASASSGVD